VEKFFTSAECEECCLNVLQENMTLDDAIGFVTCVCHIVFAMESHGMR
jgi:hypothetical protein